MCRESKKWYIFELVMSRYNIKQLILILPTEEHFYYTSFLAQADCLNAREIGEKNNEHLQIF